MPPGAPFCPWCGALAASQSGSAQLPGAASFPAGRAPAGWYPDPHGQGRRWFDGERWTDRFVPQAPARITRSRFSPWRLLPSLVLLVVIVAYVISQLDLSTSSPPTGGGDLDLGKEVFYFVEGSAQSADVTYTSTNGIRQQSGVDVPLVVKGATYSGLRLGRVPTGTFVSLSAQSRDDTGSITCRIEADGKTISTNTSTGAYVIASCEGTVL